MRWLIVLPFERPGFMGMDFADELRRLGHEVRTFAYRRENALYKNKSTKMAYQRVIGAKLERACAAWRPSLVLVIKGSPIFPVVIHRIRASTEALFLNVFPDNPLLMMPIECVEAYDLFFVKDHYVQRSLEAAGLRNLSYLPFYCVPELHHPVSLSAVERARYGACISFVGSRYPYRERFVKELASYPIRLWGGGWTKARDPEIRRMVAGSLILGREKLLVYCGSVLSLNHHHPLNDVFGVNTRAFELAAAAACQVVDLKDDLPALFKPGTEIVAYRDLAELTRSLDYYLAHPDEAAAIGANARQRALAEHTLRHRIDEIIEAVEARFGRRG
jgi:spore maturation protein CgeB